MFFRFFFVAKTQRMVQDETSQQQQQHQQKKREKEIKKKIPGLFLDDNKVDIGGDEEEKAGEHFMQEDP